MGRPLNKKWFGNENVNDSGETQSNLTPASGVQIEGEGVASVTINTAGSYSAGLPSVTFSAPNLAGAGGVTATGVTHGKALSAATTANGSGYNFGDVLTVVGGTSTTAATFTVASTLVVSAVKSAGGTGYADGDLLTFSTGFSPSLILRVNRPGGGTGSPDNFTITQAGRRTSANPTNPVTYDSRTGSGSGCTVTLGFGVYSFSTVVQEGDYTAMPSNPVSFTGGSGTGAAATVPFGVKSVYVTDPGSGYTTVADAAITFSAGAAAATPVLTVASDTPYSAEAFPSIIAYGVATLGGTNQYADIIKQENTTRYKIRTGDGVGYCNLKTTGVASAVGEMTIKATDSAGKTYYVKKLTARRVTLVPYGSSGWLFPSTTESDGTVVYQSAHWTMTTSDPTYNSSTTVIIENA